MTARYRTLLSWRWLGLTALALVLVAVCVFLGTWQYDRYSARAELNERKVAAQYDTSPTDVSAVLSVGVAPDDANVWTKVAATGRFDPDGQVLIRNRGVNTKTGYEVIVPLLLDDGTAVLVNRGWIPASMEGATVLPTVPEVPSGIVTVVGTLHPSEGERGGLNEVEGVTQARSINVGLIAEGLDYEVRAGFITDAEPGEGFTAIPITEERSWQNFAYAYQWWLFALMIPVGLVVLARRDMASVASAQ